MTTEAEGSSKGEALPRGASNGTRKGWRRLRHDWRWLLLPIALLAFGLGVWGFHRGGPGQPPQPWMASVITTLQLFVLNVSGDALPNGQTMVAAFLALIAAFAVATLAVGNWARKGAQRFALRFRGADELFLGGGDTAAGIGMRRHAVLAAEGRQRRRRPKMVGIDPAAATPLGRAMEDFGCERFLHQGDALIDDDLQSLHLHRARNVWVVTGDDLRNLEIARRVHQLVSARSTTSAGRIGGGEPAHGSVAVRVLVNVYDRHLIRAATNSLFPVQRSAGAPVVEFFSMPRLAARTLLRAFPALPPAGADGRPRPAHGVSPPHVLIVGTGDLAAALVVHVAQHLVFNDAPEQAVRISLVGAGAVDRVGALRQAFPALEEQSGHPSLRPLLPVARLAARDCSEVSLDPQTWAELQAEQRFDAVYIACEKDLQTHEAALRVAALRDMVPGAVGEAPFIVACLQQPPGTLGALRQCHDDQGIAGLFDFHVFDRCLRPGEDYPGQAGDRRAKEILAAYIRSQDATMTNEAAKAQAAKQWRSDADAMRWSNRLSADHMDVKLDILAASGLCGAWRASSSQERLEQLAGPLGRADVIEMLGRIEHRRYVIERLLDGWLPRSPLAKERDQEWRFASGLDYARQKSRLRLNVTLVPYDDLRIADPRSDQAEKDKKIVEQIRDILALEAQRSAAQDSEASAGPTVATSSAPNAPLNGRN